MVSYKVYETTLVVELFTGVLPWFPVRSETGRQDVTLVQTYSWFEHIKSILDFDPSSLLYHLLSWIMGSIDLLFV